MTPQKLILPLFAVCAAMCTPYVAASVIGHNDSSNETSTVNFRSSASLLHRSKHICSGVILNKRWILTSANCIQMHLNVTELLISYGSTDRNAADRTDVSAEKIVMHPNFNSISLENNVALIRTKNDINFSDSIEPAKLPNKNTLEDENAYAIGWENGSEQVLVHKFQSLLLLTLNLIACCFWKWI